MLKDENKFNELMEKYYKSVVMFCMSYRIQFCDAESIVNDAFTRLWSIWPERAQYTPIENKKWLINSVKIIIKEEYRNKNKHSVQNIEDYSNTISDDDFTENIVSDIADDEFLRKIDDKLTYEERELFNNRFILGFDYNELEETHGIEYSLLRVKVHRLKEKLKKILKNI